MRQISNTYEWLRWLHKKRRFMGPAILTVRGAEVVLATPEEAKALQPVVEQVAPLEEEQE